MKGLQITPLEEQKTLFIIRGLPHTGKAAIADHLTIFNCCSDMYFIDQKGNYNFDSTKLNESHEWCYEQIRMYMEVGTSVVAVHNTFTRTWEYERYIHLAKELGYNINIIETKTFDPPKDKVLKAPTEKIREMVERWEPITKPTFNLLKLP